MKNMLFKVGFSVLIIAAVLAIMGGVATAAAPDTNIIEKVNAIWGLLTGSKGVAPTYDKLVALQDQITDVHSDVASVSAKVDGVTDNMIRMETGTDEFVVNSSGYQVLVEEEYPELRHVTLSVSWGGLSLGEVFGVTGFVGQTGNSLLGVGPVVSEEEEYGYATFEITTDHWMIATANLVEDAFFTVKYNVSTLYVPAP